MIKVCDAIMGSGKSQAAIAYMNEHADKSFIYITPFLGEAERIVNGCPELNFVQPRQDKEFSYSKVGHTLSLVKNNANIATTHSAFRCYTPELCKELKKRHYTIIIDEAVDVFKEVTYDGDDMKLLEDSGYISVDDAGMMHVTDKEYNGGIFRKVINDMKRQNLVNANGTGFYWVLNKDLLDSFDDVFVLTYLFRFQDFKYLLDIYGMDYSYIGISRDGDKYRFADHVDYIPAYTKDIASQIEIFSQGKLRDIGWRRTALSAEWFKNNPAGRRQLKRNVSNYVLNYKKSSAKRVMWSTFKQYIPSVSGSTHSAKRHIPFNSKATNEYRDRDVLAYCVNVFASPIKVYMLKHLGTIFDSDGFALSTMVQWIWRSAIRDGKPISIYIPSRRMRWLLIGWMNSFKNKHPECEPSPIRFLRDLKPGDIVRIGGDAPARVWTPEKEAMIGLDVTVKSVNAHSIQIEEDGGKGSWPKNALQGICKMMEDEK